MKNKFFLIMVVFLLLVALLPAMAQDTRYRVAVLPFDDGSIQRWWGGSWDVGKGVADELLTELFKTNRFRLVEREQIEKVLREQDFGQQGRVDPRTAAKIGKILGVQYLIMGKVTEFSTDNKGGAVAIKGYGLGVQTNTARVAIDARLVNTTTAEIKAAATGKGEKKQSNLAASVKWNAVAFGSTEFKQTNLGIALRQAVEDVAKQIAEQAYQGDGLSNSTPTLEGLVADVYGNKVYITIGSSDGVKAGMVFEVQHVIRVVKNPSTGEVIDYVTEPVATISVTDVKDQSATCTIVSRLTTKYQITANDMVVLKK